MRIETFRREQEEGPGARVRCSTSSGSGALSRECSRSSSSSGATQTRDERQGAKRPRTLARENGNAEAAAAAAMAFELVFGAGDAEAPLGPAKGRRHRGRVHAARQEPPPREHADPHRGWRLAHYAAFYVRPQVVNCFPHMSLEMYQELLKNRSLVIVTHDLSRSL